MINNREKARPLALVTSAGAGSNVYQRRKEEEKGVNKHRTDKHAQGVSGKDIFACGGMVRRT